MNSNKKSILIHSLFLSTTLMLCGVFMTHCKKFEVSQQVIVKSEGISEISLNSCRASGTLVDIGSTGVTQHGFCWSLTQNPAESTDCKLLGSKSAKGSFSETIEDLSPGIQYFVWAFGENDEGRKYGDAMNFTTLSPTLPVVETGGVLNITSTSAQCEYNVLSDGGSPLTERGLCWGTSPNPSIDGPHTTEGTGTGLHTGTMNELVPETDYYVRAFAINSEGVAYGNDNTFATLVETSTPEVRTDAVEEITSTTAHVSGTINSDGGSAITAKGFCWNTEPNPTIDNFSHVVGSGPDPFGLTLEGLSPNTDYYIRAFATNINGNSYGAQLAFRTLNEVLVDERDGKEYLTVKIGDQVWMAQNLDIGDMINGNLDPSDNGTIEKYCFQNKTSNCDSYGGIYAWDEMMQYDVTEGSQGICPDGWHIPSDEEWKVLEMTLGMSREQADGEDWRGVDQGGKLKVPGVEFWDGPNEGATNESGFSALPAGGVDNIGDFSGQGFFADYWTSSWDGSNAWYRYLNADHADIQRTRGNNDFGTSVRCVKD